MALYIANLVNLIEENNKTESHHFVYDLVVFYWAFLCRCNVCIWSQLNHCIIYDITVRNSIIEPMDLLVLCLQPQMLLVCLTKD